MNITAVLCALASAALFGASTPAAKLLIGSVDPWLLAGLLYLGAGVGLAVVRRMWSAGTGRAEAPLARGDLPWLGGAILSGGVIGPVLLLVGLARTPATTASLLLTLEGVATALIAWFAFRENFDRRIALGMVAIAAGAALLSWPEHLVFQEMLGPLAIVGACVAWGVDNNLTRRVALADPVQIAMLKGLVAGPVNIALAVAGGAALPPLGAAAVAGVVGVCGYGFSLALFVVALRHLGAARTGAYFSTAPFIGALAAILLLGEEMSGRLLAAGALMGLGVWLHLTERHEHEHEHESLEHSHLHVHDAHHRHPHGPDVPAGEPHTHRHAHVRLRHTHRHLPDSHHRHRHKA